MPPHGEHHAAAPVAGRGEHAGWPRRARRLAAALAGNEYGSGSSRDWAAKGTALLGVRVVVAASFGRIHRSNLIGMGVLPLQFAPGEDAGSGRASR